MALVNIDPEVENNLLFIEDVERWLDENRHLLDREHGSRNPFLLENLRAVGAISTDELEACLAVRQA